MASDNIENGSLPPEAKPDQAHAASSWEKSTIEKLLLEGIKEQKRRRRWSIFFKLLFFAWLFLLASLFIPAKEISDGHRIKKHVGLVDLDGAIFDGAEASADHVVEGLTEALKDPKTVAVILRINSPGGSPVQADDIYNNVMRLRRDYPDKKVYAVCRDVCASAAYYVASASDQIYANPATLVGSIGVLMDGFGFTNAMQKIGIDRRLFTAGSEKSFLDPFSPLKPQDVTYAQDILNQVHQQFINAVKKGRGSRLKKDPILFTGLAWTGEQAKDLGLIDGFGSAGYVARNIIHVDNIVNYTKKPGLFEQLSKSMGASFSHEIAATLNLDGTRPLK